MHRTRVTTSKGTPIVVLEPVSELRDRLEAADRFILLQTEDGPRWLRASSISELTDIGTVCDYSGPIIGATHGEGRELSYAEILATVHAEFPYPDQGTLAQTIEDLLDTHHLVETAPGTYRYPAFGAEGPIDVGRSVSARQREDALARVRGKASAIHPRPNPPSRPRAS